MPLLVLVIMIQLVLCGGLFAVDGRPVLEQLSWFVPARWGFSMAAATVDLAPLVRGAADLTWTHAVDTWLMDAAGLGVLALAFATLTWVLLGRLDPQQSRRRG
jgi:ABC transport system ATP-binding/permease protein